MAGGTRELLLKFLGDASGLKKATGEADAATATFGTNLKNLAGTVASAYATKKVIEFGKASVQAATEDAASQQTLATTLKNVTGATEEQIAAAEGFIGKLQDATGVTDDVLRPALDRLVRSTHDVGEAQSLLQLAMDVSAGTGKDLQSVSDALAKAHDGNTTALKRLGIQTKDAEGNALSFDETLQSLSSTFGGQAAAAADTQAGKLAIMKARYGELQESIGNALLPVLGELTGVLSGLLGWFNNLDSGTQQWIARIAILGGGLLGVAKTISGVSKMVQQLQSAGKLASGALDKIGVSGKGAGVALGLLGVAVTAYALHQEELNREAQQFSDWANNLGRKSLDELASSTLLLIQTSKGFKDLSPEETMRKVAEESLGSAIAVRDAALASEEFAAQLGQLGLSVGELEGIINDEVAAQKRQEESARKADAAVEDYDESMGSAETAAKGMGGAVRKAGGDMDVTRGSTSGLETATRQAAGSIDLVAAAYERLHGLISTERTALQLSKDFDALRESNVNAIKAVADGSLTYEEATRDMRLETLAFKDEVLDHLATLKDVPPEKATEILTLIDEGKLDEAEWALAVLTQEKTVDIRVRFVGPGGDILKTLLIDPKTGLAPLTAEGGVFRSRQVRTIAEAGAEAVIPLNDPTRAGQVLEQAGLIGSGGTTIIENHYHGPVMTENDWTRKQWDNMIDARRRGELVGSLG